jgi:hypothetical protein
MTEAYGRPAFGDRVTLACSCQAEVVMPLIIFLPRHSVVRVVANDSRCQGLAHAIGSGLVVRWSDDVVVRVCKDAHAASFLTNG